MNLVEMTFTLSTSGTAGFTSPYVCGEVVSVRVPNAGTAWMPGGTADLTLTRAVDGGTILALTNVTAPFEYNPRAAAHSNTGGTTAYSLGVGPVYSEGLPVAGALQLAVAQGTVSATPPAGTVYVYVCD